MKETSYMIMIMAPRLCSKNPQQLHFFCAVRRRGIRNGHVMTTYNVNLTFPCRMYRTDFESHRHRIQAYIPRYVFYKTLSKTARFFSINMSADRENQYFFIEKPLTQRNVTLHETSSSKSFSFYCISPH